MEELEGWENKLKMLQNELADMNKKYRVVFDEGGDSGV